jgi:hypothetical protein
MKNPLHFLDFFYLFLVALILGIHLSCAPFKEDPEYEYESTTVVRYKEMIRDGRETKWFGFLESENKRTAIIILSDTNDWKKGDKRKFAFKK